MTIRPRLDLEAARNRTLPDVLPELGAPFRVLFCGINPGLYSAATGWHFARPGNRFWPALHRSGFTPRQLAPREQDLLPGLGLGITNLVARPTAQASELDSSELKVGRERLAALVDQYRPRIVAIAGVTAYRTAFGQLRAGTGPQPDPLGPARVWILPNPSGLNAHTSIPLLAEDMQKLRQAASTEPLPIAGMSSWIVTTRQGVGAINDHVRCDSRGAWYMDPGRGPYVLSPGRGPYALFWKDFCSDRAKEVQGVGLRRAAAR
jgi:double-stranded uracil-DNA glycosylase